VAADATVEAMAAAVVAAAAATTASHAGKVKGQKVKGKSEDEEHAFHPRFYLLMNRSVSPA
ncbi:MAG TPA: hypothetical protein VIW80_10785, partial [Pyrinomonadaceae bacterium]